MANWKKVIVSGSDAHLRNITGSGKLKFPNLDITESLSLKPLVIDSNGVIYKGSGSISASYAVSSSYAVTASYISADNIDGQVGFPYSGSDFIGETNTPDAAVITGSLILQSGVSSSGNITASGTISASGDLIVKNATVNQITASSDISGSGDLIIKNISASGDITASGNIVGNKYYIDGTGNRLAEKTSNSIIIGDPNLGLEFTSSKGFIISASGGVTMSNVPIITRPPFILAIESDEKGGTPNIVKIPLSQVGGGGTPGTNTNSITNFTTCSDNSNIGLTVTAGETTTEEVFLGEITINDITDVNNLTFQDGNGTITANSNTEFVFKPNSGYVSGTLQPGDTVIIRNNGGSIPGTLGGNLEHTTTISSVFNLPSTNGGASDFIGPGPAWLNSANRIYAESFSYEQGFSMSLSTAPSSNDIYELYSSVDDGNDNYSIPVRNRLQYDVFKVVSDSQSTVQICLEDDLSLNDITQSGDLLFSGSANHSHSIGIAKYGSPITSSYLKINASDIDVTGTISASVIGADTYELSGFQFLDIGGASITGSTDFGTSSLDTHKFTGSMFVSGTITSNEVVNGIGFIGTSSHAKSASYAATASYISSDSIDGQVGFPYSGSDFIGSANTPDAAVITGSLILQSGTSGSGNITASGTISASGGFTGSLFGTASYALSSSQAESASYSLSSSQAESASYALSSSQAENAVTASYISSDNIDGQVGFPYSGSDFIGETDTPDAAVITGSLILQSGVSSSGNITASGTISASGGFTGSLFGTASYSISSSQAESSSYALSSSKAESASYATTASYISLDSIDGQVGFPYSGSDFIGKTNTPDAAVITGSLILQSGISSSGNITASGTISASGDIKGNNIIAANNLTVGGNLTVNGTTTTLNTTDLVVEDRFIVIGSGSNSSTSMDVGIIFDSGSLDGTGMALYYQNNKNRISIANRVINVHASSVENEDGIPLTRNILDHLGNSNEAKEASHAGFVNTVREVNFVGTELSGSVNTAKSASAQMGVGEMAVDSEGDIWIYSK